MCSSPKSSGRRRFNPSPKYGYLAGLSATQQNSFTLIANAAEERRTIKKQQLINSSHLTEKVSIQILHESTENRSNGMFNWLLRMDIRELYLLIRA